MGLCVVSQIFCVSLWPNRFYHLKQPDFMINRLLKFLDASPVNFLAARNIALELEQNGYRRLNPQQPIGTLKAGDKVYVTKNDSSVYAFHIGRDRKSVV